MEWEREVTAMERVCQEIAETLQNTIRTLDESIRETDAALAEIAKEKKLTHALLREMGIGQ
jgi:prefoldin subunit 5